MGPPVDMNAARQHLRVDKVEVVRRKSEPIHMFRDSLFNLR
jgi:hypothetical protein